MNARVDIQIGIVHDMPIAEYHATPALGSSGLRKLARSPAHYYAAMLDPQRPISEPTAAMRAGTLAHCAILEPDQLSERYVVRPEGMDGRTKEGKAWLASISLDREVVSAEQMLTATRQAIAIRALPEIGSLLDNGRAEVSAFTVDPETFVFLKARPDWCSPAGDNGVVLVDVKTATSASAQDFPRSVVNFGYACQAAHYTTVYEAASEQMVLGFVFACVESDWPHAAAAFMLQDEWLDMARRKNQRLINIYAECLRKNKWPGYSETIQVLEMPRWITDSP